MKMNIGINTAIRNAKTDIIAVINKKIEEGIPLAVIDMICQSALLEIQSGLDAIIKNEQEQIKEEQEAITEQVDWEEPVSTSKSKK